MSTEFSCDSVVNVLFIELQEVHVKFTYGEVQGQVKNIQFQVAFIAIILLESNAQRLGFRISVRQERRVRLAL